MRYNSQIKLILLYLFIFVPSIFPQWDFSLSTYQEFNSNPFRAVNASSELISTFDLGIQKEFENLSFNILYYGNYNNFSKSFEMNYYWHQLGVYSSTENFGWGIYAEQRINKPEINYFDYFNYADYVNKSFNFFDINWEGNLSFNSMNYSVISDFNNWVASGRILARKSFLTKTTLIGTIVFNYKGFKNYISNIDSTYGDDYIYYTSEDVNVSQIELNCRIAQSVGEKTGLALNVHYKDILSGSGFSASLFESTYGDMELYDDPISQEGYSVGGMLTHIFFEDLVTRLSYFYYSKIYPSQGVYFSETEYNTELFREDTQNVFSLYLSKTIYLNNTNGNMLDLSFNATMLNNKSNSYYFNYDMNYFSLQLSFNF
jgi:hypothetical protein